VAFAAQRFMARTKLRQHVAQPGVVGFFLLERPQRNTDGIDQVAEGAFDVVERGDPALGVDQQVAQRLVALADAGTEIGKRRRAVRRRAVRAGLLGGCGHRKGCGRGCSALTPEKIRDGTHGIPSPLTTTGKAILIFGTCRHKQVP
jgi:hypothetical protein